MHKYLYYLIPSIAGVLLPLTIFNPFNSGKTALMNIPLSKGVAYLNGQKTDESANRSTDDEQVSNRTELHGSDDGTNGKTTILERQRIQSLSTATVDQSSANIEKSALRNGDRFVSERNDRIVVNVVCVSNYRAMNLRSSPNFSNNILAVIPCNTEIELITDQLYTNDGVQWYLASYGNKSGYIAKGGIRVRN